MCGANVGQGFSYGIVVKSDQLTATGVDARHLATVGRDHSSVHAGDDICGQKLDVSQRSLTVKITSQNQTQHRTVVPNTFSTISTARRPFNRSEPDSS